ncbi:MAG: YfcE family phosphodiesterase [Pseudomonadota bacterium]
MRIGIVSDTHNNLKNVAKIVELFNQAGVDQVVHTGDVTQAKTIDVFGDLTMPMFGVYGNNDEERDTLDAAIAAHGFEFFEPPYQLDLAGRSIIVVHDPLEFEGALHQGHELALHGHTHRYRLESWGTQTTIFNPGECAGLMTGFNSIGIVDLSSLETEILKF